MKHCRFTALRRAFVPALFALVISTAVLAAKDSFGSPGPQTFEFDPTAAKPWKESAIVLPAFPDNRNLVAVPLAPADTIKLYVDTASVSRTEDGVARFALVIETAAGARNVLYEGIRCETREYKTYATGTADGKLQALKDPAWRPIPNVTLNAFRQHLYEHYVCDETSSARSPRALLDRIRHAQ